MADPATSEAFEEIPDKLYFRIGEVAACVGVPAYVLRYWETEFPQVAPRKSGRDHRLYRRKDVEALLEIKRLLYEERFTVEGARKVLESRSTGAKAKPKLGRPIQGKLFPAEEPGVMAEIRRELREILDLLGS